MDVQDEWHPLEPAETTPLLQASPAGDKSYFEIVTLRFRTQLPPRTERGVICRLISLYPGYLLKGLDSTQKAFENDTLAKYILFSTT